MHALLRTLSPALALMLAASCSDKPPPPRYPGDPSAYVPPQGVPPGETPTEQLEAPTPSAAPSVPNPYPATPTAPPPVPLPAGDGIRVPLERYIVVDQLGYRTNLAKVAILVDPERGWNAGDRYVPAGTLEVRRWSDDKSVWKGNPTTWNRGALDESSGDRGSWLDFSALKTPGLYYVFDPKHGTRSYPFAIGDDVYKGALKSATRMYYFNRANFEKKPPYSCVDKRCWSLGADYLGPGQDKEARSIKDRDNPKTARDLSGGWWDAGDTNKYVTFTSEPVHQLLTAFEEHPEAFTDDFGIPESGNGVPDLIDELMVELAWLSRMQPPDLKGGALIKVGVAEFGEGIPDQSRLPRFYYPGACSSATIVVAGEFAHAARVLKRFPRYTAAVASLTQRARDAWRHFNASPKNESCDDGTIKAGDADRSLAEQTQDAVVAAAYLFALTGDREFDEFVAKNHAVTRAMKEDHWTVYQPSQGDALMLYASLTNSEEKTKQAILAKRKSLLGNNLGKFQPDLDLYRAFMRPYMYHWGSNNQRAAIGNAAYDAIRHNLVPSEQQADFVERAAGMLHSFHGVNPMQLVYLTNLYADGGDACADEMFHNWFRDKDPLWDNARRGLGPAPGYVTGGPNQQYCQRQDPAKHACAKSALREQPRGKTYIDSNTGWEPTNPFDRSWELTEPGIYYQASYVRLVSKFVN